ARPARPAGVAGPAGDAGPREVGRVVGPGRVVDAVVGLLAAPVVAAQHRSVVVGDLGPGGDGPADESAEAGHMLLREIAVGAVGQEAVEREPQVGVDLVPVEPDGLVVDRVVGKHTSTVLPDRLLPPDRRCPPAPPAWTSPTPLLPTSHAGRPLRVAWP